jgi:hypothetical protein
MKLFTTTAVLFASLAFSLPIHAGSGHSHDKDGGHSHGAISNKKAVAKGLAKVKFLAQKGTIDKSWVGITQGSAAKKTFNHNPEWVVMFKNDKIKDKSKQSLYIFFSLDGHYIAANYTGK